MKRLRWQFLIVFLALVAIGALLLSQQPAVLTGIDTIIEPTSGGVYTEALIGSPGRLNPLLDYMNQADRTIDSLIFSSLVKFNSRSLPEGDLAESWGISQDGTVYNISIREDATWHDGAPLTSGDVLFTLDLIKNQSIPLPEDLKEFWGQIQVKALDERTLQFQLPEPYAPFLDYLTFGILPKHLLENVTAEELIDHPFNINPVGSGPFKFKNLLVENGVISGVDLVTNENYYGEKPYISGITFNYYPDASSAMAAYQSGEVLGISEISPEILSGALKETGLNVYTGRRPRLDLVLLNQALPSKPFFQEAAVRKALFLGLNRRWIVDRILNGQAITANGPVFPESWAYYEGIDQLDYDPDAAIEILKEAGYTIPAEGGSIRAKEGVSLEFELVYPISELYQQIAESIQKDWSKLGVKANLKAVPYEELVANFLEPRTFDSALVELNLDRSPDPDPYPFWHQAQKVDGQNYSGWDDRQASEYLEQGRVLVDLSERIRRYKNFQVRFAAELPALPLFFPVYTFGADEQVQGISMGPIFDPSDRFSTINSWYLVTGAAVVTEIAPDNRP